MNLSGARQLKRLAASVRVMMGCCTEIVCRSTWHRCARRVASRRTPSLSISGRESSSNHSFGSSHAPARCAQTFPCMCSTLKLIMHGGPWHATLAPHKPSQRRPPQANALRAMDGTTSGAFTSTSSLRISIVHGPCHSWSAIVDLTIVYQASALLAIVSSAALYSDCDRDCLPNASLLQHSLLTSAPSPSMALPRSAGAVLV